MSIPVMVLGESGTGKSASLRNLDPNRTLLIQTIKKPLPFRSRGWKPAVTDSWERIISGIRKAEELGKEIVVIDDFQYLLANEFMRRSQEKGFDKFTEIGHHAWSVMMAAQQAAEHVRVYLLSHTQTDDFGNTKAKTIGKLLDEKITVEGLFTIVLRTIVSDQGYHFSTQNNGADTVKTPIGLFDQNRIDNDLALVDSAICSYYGINQPAEEKAA
ncbi:AAA family ATPase [Microbulbifer sp. TYP-18]|uniref:AAA family ATPase n=1 Tax=Microbulbifer sp. TYP-18 TaxID=3230024 RepID=UPI0034C660AD